MKKLLFGILILIHFFSCTNDNELDSPDLLVGKWSYDYDNFYGVDDSNLIVTSIFEIKNDSSFIFSEIVSEKSTRRLLGYRYKKIGTYEINENKLTFLLSGIYSYENNTSGNYLDLDELEFRNVDDYDEYIFSVKRNDLALLYICKPNELCAKVPPTIYDNILD